MQKTSWLTYFFPQSVLRTSSRYNPDIRVIGEAGRLKLLVNGSRQSGPYIEKLWRHAFKCFGVNNNLMVKRILILGVGGGTVIHLLRSIFPKANIYGVEIDPVMMEIGQKYFGLDVSLFKVIRADAKQFVRKRLRPFDLIIVDLFIGREIPSFVRSTRFLADLKRLKKKAGCIVINYLREKEYQALSDEFDRKLRLIFTTVRDAEVANNRFFFVK